jgi:ubiquinone/menaquinone biosynthesis C-methylase UbiE
MEGKKDFSNLDVWWDEYKAYYKNRTWEDSRYLLAEVVQYATEGPILDIGCGYGFLLECARRLGIKAIGLDGSAKALSFCKKLHPQANIIFWKAGANIPLSSNSIGVVVMNQFVDHITYEENILAFSEAFRILKYGGILIVKSPSKYNQFDDDRGHVTFFSPSEFKDFVQSFSFKVIVQPYYLQPILGTSKIASIIMRALIKFYRPEKWSATIDLIAKK